MNCKECTENYGFNIDMLEIAPRVYECQNCGSIVNTLTEAEAKEIETSLKALANLLDKTEQLEEINTDNILSYAAEDQQQDNYTADKDSWSSFKEFILSELEYNIITF